MTLQQMRYVVMILLSYWTDSVQPTYNHADRNMPLAKSIYLFSLILHMAQPQAVNFLSSLLQWHSLQNNQGLPLDVRPLPWD